MNKKIINYPELDDCSFPSSCFTAIKLAAHRSVGAGLPAIGCRRSLGLPASFADKPAPTGLNLMAVKLLLGNGVFEALASRRTVQQELAR